MSSTFLKSSKALLLILLYFSPIHKINAQVTYEIAYPNLSFEFPTEIQPSNDGTNRLFVVEQPGSIKVFPNQSTVLSSDVSTFLDISSNVSYNAGQEIGLLGLAFHPDYSQNGYFYVYYVDRGTNFQMVLARYQVSATNANVANPNSETILFRFEKNQNNSNHNGGKIAFGPDGYLYASIGDGGGGGDPSGNGQNLNTPFGSILRIDVDLDGNNPIETNPDLPNGNYEIPSDNPRVGQNGLDEIYAWGIRNTWKFTFDNQTGRIWGADVGQDTFEEINLIQSGGNYGWNRFEAESTYASSTDLVTTPDIKPIYFYNHNNGDVSITGGYVYRGTNTNPSLQGRYIYGDYASGRVWSLNYNEGSNTATSELLFRTNGQYVSSFGLDEAGEIYFSDYGSNARIYKIVGGVNEPVTTAINGIGVWSGLDSGINGVVETLALGIDNAIYIGGEFTSAGGVSANNLAIYDPINGWQAFGSGSNGIINSIAVASNGNIYAGGDFTEIGGISANYIAVWNGNDWSPLDSGTNGPVSKIGIGPNGNVYVGGAFATAGGITVNNICFWNGTTWSALTDATSNISGTNNEIRSIAFDTDNTIYVGGNFDSAGGRPAPRIATWNGANWGTLGDGTSGFVQAIVVRSNYIYAGGNFAIAGNRTVNRIARWNRNTNSWESLGFGISGNVKDMKHDGNYLYTAGNFETASDIENVNEIMNNVARWSENEGWEALGIDTSVGVDNQANALVFSEDNLQLYVGGNYETAGEINASNISVWQADASLPPSDLENMAIIYPNPFIDNLNIRFEDELNQNINVSIYTISGILVSSQVLFIDNGLLTIDISILSSGLYYLKLDSESIHNAYKIIKR